jgi:RimJ/RimL family protein N-acetyltransferase
VRHTVLCDHVTATWPIIESPATPRLTLSALTQDAVSEMVAVLADRTIYEFTGGEPPSSQVLRERYTRQSVGVSLDRSKWWLNWIVRADHGPIGFVQATVEDRDTARTGELAWVLTPSAHGRGYATEAARATMNWLARHGVRQFRASIHPDHEASSNVARRLGMAPNGCVDKDGEAQWVVEV